MTAAPRVTGPARIPIKSASGPRHARPDASAPRRCLSFSTATASLLLIALPLRPRQACQVQRHRLPQPRFRITCARMVPPQSRAAATMCVPLHAPFRASCRAVRMASAASLATATGATQPPPRHPRRPHRRPLSRRRQAPRRRCRPGASTGSSGTSAAPPATRPATTWSRSAWAPRPASLAASARRPSPSSGTATASRPQTARPRRRPRPAKPPPRLPPCLQTMSAMMGLHPSKAAATMPAHRVAPSRASCRVAATATAASPAPATAAARRRLRTA